MTDSLNTQNPFAGIDSNKGRSDDRTARLEALAAMHATPRANRAAAGMPLTDKAFAEHWGVVANRITKDKQSPEFKKLLAEAKERNARQLDPRGSAALTEAKIAEFANDDLSTYEALKGQLAAEAMAGEHKALELWLKTWGAPFVQEEVNRVDAVSNLDDRELVEEIIELVDTGLLVSILKDRGLI